MKHRMSVPAASAVLCGLAALGLAAPAVAGSGARVADSLTRYSTVQAPQGATAKVHSVETGSGRTIVTLHVRGLLPHTPYGAHAHVNACDALDPTKAGPHYQDVKGDPTSPEFANPHNEIWLDITTDASGNGHAKAVVDWQFAPDRRAKSVILHERHTSTGAGEAGTAGARVACLTVPF